MLAATSHAEACDIGARVDGRRLPIQSWHLMERIRELDALLVGDAALRDRLFECHPELCFQALRGAPLAAGKKSAAGRRARIQLIDGAFGTGCFAEHRARHRTSVADDDLLDALALLWSAERIAAGRARSLPETPVHDGMGLAMRITY